MLSEKLAAQDFAVRVLISHLETERLAHTYVLTGTPSSGKEDIAQAFARALNCLKQNFFKDCGCTSCHKIENAQHPDVHWLGEDEKARSVKIEEVRESIGAAALKPYEGKWKVFIVLDAERLTPDASNALLKTLEEPPAHTIFILLSETKANLLETIQSRSFEIRLRPLEEGRATSEMLSSLGDILQNKNWEEFLDQEKSSRDELGKFLDVLLDYFRAGLEKEAVRGFTRGPALLRAVDLVTEAKDALSSNVNQKLLLSRLAMQLRRAFPERVFA